MAEKFVLCVGYLVCGVGSIAATIAIIYWLCDITAQHLQVIKAFYWFVYDRNRRLAAIEKAKTKPKD
jgi:hypothetical protein